MTNISRRSALLGAGALTVASLPNRLHAHIDANGSWTPRADMPFPVQEIYPAPFWKTPDDAMGLKPQPYNILVNAGGLTPGGDFNITDAVTFYDPSYNRWGYGPRLPEARHHLNLVNNNGFIYGVGGFARNENGGWQMRRDCWRLGSIDGQWERRKAMPHPQAESVCASLGGFVHVAGGRAPAGSRNAEWSDHIDTDQHWIYDASADSWHSLAPMPTARNSAAGAVVGGVLFVIGGRTVNDGNLTTVEVYDPLSDRWQQARPLPKAQAGLAASVLHGRIYVFGGEYFSTTGGGVFSDTWEYNPRTDEWRAVAPMPRPRHGLGAVTLDEAIYVVGGASQAGGNQTTATLDKFEITR